MDLKSLVNNIEGIKKKINDISNDIENIHLTDTSNTILKCERNNLFEELQYFYDTYDVIEK